MKISIIVPCYNEEAALPIFYKEVKKVLMGLTSTYELIFVNDGSKDHTLPLLRQLAEEDKNVTYYSFSRNFGKEAAMYAGFCNAHGDYVAVMDADMQEPSRPSSENDRDSRKWRLRQRRNTPRKSAG